MRELRAGGEAGRRVASPRVLFLPPPLPLELPEGEKAARHARGPALSLHVRKL